MKIKYNITILVIMLVIISFVGADLESDLDKLGDQIPISIVLPTEKANETINWTIYDKLSAVELDELTKYRGVQVKHDYQLVELEEKYPGKIKRTEEEYLKIKYTPLPTPQQVIEMQSEINKLILENKKLEDKREKELNSELQDRFAMQINKNNEIIDEMYSVLELEEKKDYYIRKIETLKDKYAAVLIEEEIRDKVAFERNPIGTVYYIDWVNGDNANNGTHWTGAWRNLSQYTSVTIRSAGDIAYVRAGQEHIYNTSDIIFDEDGLVNNYISIIGCNSTTDPWSDGIDTKTNISFGGNSYQMNLNGDNYWEFQNLVFRNSADGNGIVDSTNSLLPVFKNCVFRDGVGTIVEGVRVSGFPAYFYNCEMYNISSSGYQLNSIVYIDGGIVNLGTVGTTYGVWSNSAYVILKNINITGNDYDLRSLKGLIYGTNINLGSSDEKLSDINSFVVKIGDKDFVVGSHTSWFFNGQIDADESNIRIGGANSSAKMQPTTFCEINTPLTITDNPKGDFQLWLPASEQTVTIYIKGYSWSSYPTNSQLYVEAEYLNTADGSSRSSVKSTEVLTDNTNWVAFTTTFTPSQAGWVYLTVKLGKYVFGDGIYVDIKPVVS